MPLFTERHFLCQNELVIKRGFSGFTLIELLVVIGVLAVISSGVVALIDPVDKNRAAQDAKVQNDLGQVATGIQAYYLQGNGFPTGSSFATMGTALVGAGELISVPAAPVGSGYFYDNTAGSIRLFFELLSKKYTNQCLVAPQTTPYWTWCSTTGRIGVECGNGAFVDAGNFGSIACP